MGRKDAKTHGLAEDASKKLQGTIWIDEADRQVAHLEVSFIDNFRMVGGILARCRRARTFASIRAGEGEIWLPTGGEGTSAGAVLMLKTSAPALSPSATTTTSDTRWRPGQNPTTRSSLRPTE